MPARVWASESRSGPAPHYPAVVKMSREKEIVPIPIHLVEDCEVGSFESAVLRVGSLSWRRGESEEACEAQRRESGCLRLTGGRNGSESGWWWWCAVTARDTALWARGGWDE